MDLLIDLGMLIGGLTWLTFELVGVCRNARNRAHGYDTTSEWVWWFERRVRWHNWRVGRFLVAGFLTWLAVHFLSHR